MILSKRERNNEAVPSAAPTLRTIDPTRRRSCIFNSLGTEPSGSGPSGRLLTAQAGRNITAIHLPFKLDNFQLLSGRPDRVESAGCRPPTRRPYPVAAPRPGYIPRPMRVSSASKTLVPGSLRSLVIAFLITAVLPSCSKGPDTPGPGATTAPPPASTPVGGPEGRFTGSDSCRECHKQEYDAWVGSRHRSTLRPWTPGTSLRLASASVPLPYVVARDGTVRGPGVDGNTVSGTVAFLVGGRHREDALVRLPDGRVQVFPVSYDVDRTESFEPLRELAGGIAPPPDSIDFWTRVGRNADIACYGCHATGQTLVREGVAPSGLVLPGSRWLEPGVGCEGCHGPAGPHIEAARAGRPSAGAIRLGRGSGTRSTDVCAACHGLRDVLPSPFAAVPAHRDGDPLYLAGEPLLSVASNFEFREPFFGDLRPATYQQEAIAFSQSGCARRGGLTCAACHDVHSGAKTAALAADDDGDGLCASCHEATAAQGTRHTLHPAGTPGGRCLDCHMASIVRGPARLPARDHSMAPPVAEPGKVPAACASCHAGAANASVVAEAWTRVVDSPAARARREIGVAVDGAETAGGLAALVRLAADPDRGWFLRWAAIQRITAAATARRSEPMIAAFLAALSDPNPALRRAGARALGRFGRSTEFAALELATSDPDPWTALAAAQAMGALGAPTSAVRLYELAQRPDLVADARAQYAYGHARLLAREWPQAETALRRALEINPMMVGAINDLGLCLRAEGKKGEADEAWKRALEINPRFGAARQNLEQSATPSASTEPTRQP